MPRKAKSPSPKIVLSSSTEIVIEGDYPNLERSLTGLYSLDSALGGGLPTRSPIEIFGFKGVGKSSLAYYMAGIVAAHVGGNIEVTPFEPIDKIYLSRALSMTGFTSKTGKVRLTPITIQDKKRGTVPADAETVLTSARDSFRDEDTVALVIDSVDAIVPTSEAQSEKIGEGQIGRRAKVMAEFMRALTFYVRMKEKPCNAFLVNHSYAIIGGRGTTTAGGEAIKNLSTVRIRLSKDTDDEDALIVKGTVEYLRYAPESRPNKLFKVVVKSGHGIHPGLTAVRDAIEIGAAVEDRTIKIGAKSFGFWKAMVDNWNDVERFQPFVDALEELRGKK